MPGMCFRSVLCALDLSDQSRGVLYHAAGLAGAAEARLSLLHVTGGDPGEAELELRRRYFETIPYGAHYLVDPHVAARSGGTTEAVLDEARERAADLIVAGSRGRGALARLLLGSTSARLLKETDRPVLLVPPGDLEVVSLSSDRVALHFGAVIAAVDLAESNDAGLRLAAALASLARQPLLLLTVGQPDDDQHQLAEALRTRARGVGVTPTAFIVRKGDVAEEIGRAARHEQSGLVVMGLRRAGRGSPGAFASAVLESGQTLVLAVPEA